jgi:hypothetical protein
VSPRVPAGAALVFGLAAVAAIPAGIEVAERSDSIGLVRSLYGSVPAAAVLGLIGVVLARRARFAVARTVRREGLALTRVSRFLAWTGVYFALIGGIALGVNEILRLRK